MQVLKREFPSGEIYKFVSDCGSHILDGKYYVFDVNNYKRSLYDNRMNDFFVQLKEYYYTTKYTLYIESRKSHMTYQSFMTILRQVCRSARVEIVKKIAYEKSKYQPHYNIFVK